MQNSDNLKASWRFWKRRRYVVAVLAFLGCVKMYVLRVNLSVAIVKMTENRTVIDEAGNIAHEQDFDWDSKVQGLVLSSFYYGYICAPLLGGWLAARFGGKCIFGLGIGVTSLLTIVTPPATRFSVYLLVATRIVEGFFEGLCLPALQAVLANWAPVAERTKLAGFTFAGGFVGTVFAMPMCSVLAERLGWDSLFYVFGVVGILWYVCWNLVVTNRPDDDPHISDAELKYIKHDFNVGDGEKVSHPWKDILKSRVVWAIIAAHFSEAWGFYTMITFLPMFMKDILDFDIEKAGFLSALPYLVMFIMLILSGYVSDFLISKKTMTTTQVRKLCNCTAFVFQTIFMACTAYIIIPSVSVICITLGVGVGGLAWSGFNVNYLDIAPKHASVIYGMGNTFATLCGIVSPILTGYIVQNKAIEEWRIVFLISSVLYLSGGLIYALFTSGEVQPWAAYDKRNDLT